MSDADILASDDPELLGAMELFIESAITDALVKLDDMQKAGLFPEFSFSQTKRTIH